MNFTNCSRVPDSQATNQSGKPMKSGSAPATPVDFPLMKPEHGSHGPGKSWNILEFKFRPRRSLNLGELEISFWKVLEFFCWCPHHAILSY